MIKKEDLKYENNLYYYEDKLFTGQSINRSNTKFWYKEGKLHRIDGPAAVYSNGNTYWFKEGLLHRDNDLPAIEYNNESKEWCKEGKWHRENGPAIEFSDGNKFYFYNGKQINCKDNEEFLRIIKLLAFK